jgi:SAM-dependent methyltransferase
MGSVSARPQFEPKELSDEALFGLLAGLYRRQIEQLPDEAYLPIHGAAAFLRGTLAVYSFYESWLPREGRLLDWGCRHAPDACLIRARQGSGLTLDGCDIIDRAVYKVFYEYSGLRYEPLFHPVLLPYADGSFDAVIASGVLEHVPMDYESLKELYRVLKPGGRLIVTYLPNAASIEEWRLRRRGRNDFHRRLYSPSGVRAMLLHSGFWPMRIAYQTQLDALPVNRTPVRWLRPALRAAQLQRLTSCLCAVAEKVSGF